MPLLLLYEMTFITSFKCFLCGIWLLKVFDIVENMSGKMLILDDIWPFGEVFHSWVICSSLCTRQTVGTLQCAPAVCWCQWCKQAGHTLQTQVHVIDSNTQRRLDKIPRTIPVPFIQRFHYVLQMLCTIPRSFLVLAWPTYSPKVPHWACLGCFGSM